MLLNSTNLSKSFSFGMLLINERLSLIPPSHGGWFFGLLLSRSLFIYIKWVISQNLESPPYNTKEYYMGDFLCTYVLNRMKLTFNSIFNV